jgi:hypothetical protein
MAELKRGETRTTITPAPIVPATALRATAEGYNSLAASANAGMDFATRQLEESRQLLEQTTLARLENDVWKKAGDLSREHEGKPEVIAGAFQAYAKERLKGAAAVLPQGSQKLMGLWEQRISNIVGKTVNAQADVAHKLMQRDAVAAHNELGTQVNHEVTLAVREVHANGQSLDEALAAARDISAVYAESAIRLSEKNLVSPTQAIHATRGVEREAMQEYVTSEATRIYSEFGPDAARKYIESIDASKLVMSADEFRHIQEEAWAQAGKVPLADAEQRAIDVVRATAAISAATTVQEARAAAGQLQPGNMTRLQQEQVRGALTVAIARMHKTETDQASQSELLMQTDQMRIAVLNNDVSALPSAGYANFLKEKDAVTFLSHLKVAEAQILAHDRDLRDRTNAKAAVDAANREQSARTETWVQIIGARKEGAPGIDDLPDLLRQGVIDDSGASRIRGAYAKRLREDGDAVAGGVLVKSKTRVSTDQDKSYVEAYHNTVIAAGGRDITDDDTQEATLRLITATGYVPKTVRNALENPATRTSQELRTLARFVSMTRQYEVFKPLSGDEARWRALSDAINSGKNDKDLNTAVLNIFGHGDPDIRAMQERALDTLKRDPTVIQDSAATMSNTIVNDANVVSRLIDSLFGTKAALSLASEQAWKDSWSAAIISLAPGVSPLLAQRIDREARNQIVMGNGQISPKQAADTAAAVIGRNAGLSFVSGTGAATMAYLPPETQYPEASGYHAEVLASWAKRALLSESTQLQEFKTFNPGLFFFSTEEPSLKALVNMVERGDLYVMPSDERGSDGRVRYNAYILDRDGATHHLVAFDNAGVEKAGTMTFDQREAVRARGEFAVLNLIPLTEARVTEIKNSLIRN